MLSLFLNIVVVCFIMSLAAVFVIQWGKKLIDAFKKPVEPVSVFLSLAALFVSAALATIAYDAFKVYLPDVSSAIQMVLTFVILGFMQLVWENYNMLKEWVLGLCKRKIEKEVEKA